MRIHAVTVCVNYADYLKTSLARWAKGCHSVGVVTDCKDEATHNLCLEHYNVGCHRTNVFYDDGANFNKGAAISLFIDSQAELMKSFTKDDWILFFDADIRPPEDWRICVDMAEPKIGNVYGAPRHSDETAMRMNDPFPAGYFLLFNSQDPNALKRPIVDTHWAHAGNYDSTFISRWHRHQLKWINMPLVHLGEPFRNWCGRGNDEAMKNLLIERGKRRDWRHETINKVNP